MCTVVCQWAPESDVPLVMLALRDELADRDFDLPAAWWPDQPTVIGGRDRSAGGTWCASDVRTAVTAVVLNRPERRAAEPGAPSRGVLPLLAVNKLTDWPNWIELAGMAGFNLVLVTPGELSWWSFDGSTLRHDRLAAGTYLFTPRGLTDPPDGRFAQLPAGPITTYGPSMSEQAGCVGQAVSTEQAWSGWLPILQASRPSADPMELLVRLPVGERSFETVFGQFIAAVPGRLRLDYLRTPDRGGDWTIGSWTTDRLVTDR